MATTICGYGCTDLEAHEQLLCGVKKQSGGNKVFVINCDHDVTDWTNKTQFNAAIAAGKVHMVEGTKPQRPAPSPVEIPSSTGCGPENELLTFTQSVTWIDRNFTPDNQLFYDSLNIFKGYIAFYLCNTQQLYVNDAYVATFQAFDVIGESKNIPIEYNATATWDGLTLPTVVPVAADFFD